MLKRILWLALFVSFLSADKIFADTLICDPPTHLENGISLPAALTLKYHLYTSTGYLREALACEFEIEETGDYYVTASYTTDAGEIVESQPSSVLNFIYIPLYKPNPPANIRTSKLVCKPDSITFKCSEEEDGP